MQLIETVKDYDAALQLIEQLWDSEEGAREGDRLEFSLL